jgi:signal transduction histidine kinase
MALRLVKKGSEGVAAGGGEPAAAAFLVVNGRGAVLDALGWETLSVEPPPRRIEAGKTEHPIVRAIGQAVEEARRTRRPSVRRIEITLERARLYAIAAAPMPGETASGEIAVTVQETGGPEASQAEGKVIRQLGHDLRTPLTSISGAVELLQSGRLCPMAPQQERVVALMQKGVEAMIRLIDESTAPFRSGIAAELGLDALGELDEEIDGSADDAGATGPKAIRDDIKKAGGMAGGRSRRGGK